LILLRLHLFIRKISFGKRFSYYLVLGTIKNHGQIENIFCWPRKPYLIPVKWYPYFKTVNYFSNLSFSFSHAPYLAVHSPPPPKVTIGVCQKFSRGRWSCHRSYLEFFVGHCYLRLLEVASCFPPRPEVSRHCRRLPLQSLIFYTSQTPKIILIEIIFLKNNLSQNIFKHKTFYVKYKRN